MTSSGFDRAPQIDTDRLRLRAHQVDDLSFCAAMWRHPDVIRFIGGKPFTREEVWARMMRYAGMWVMMGHGFWAVEEKASGHWVACIRIGPEEPDIDAVVLKNIQVQQPLELRQRP